MELLVLVLTPTTSCDASVEELDELSALFAKAEANPSDQASGLALHPFAAGRPTHVMSRLQRFNAHVPLAISKR